MRIDLIPDFPARAAKALRGAGIESTEAASTYSAASLLAIKGVGEQTLHLLSEHGWSAGDDHSLATSKIAEPAKDAIALAEGVFAPAADEPVEIAPPCYSYFPFNPSDSLAEDFITELCKNQVPTPQIVDAAWDLVNVFHQAKERAAGNPIQVYDGLAVRFQGADWTLRTKFAPGEAQPEGMRTVALVPAETK